MNAQELAKEFSHGTRTPVDELDDIVAKIKASPSIFISTTFDRAYREAQASTIRWQAKMPLSPFDGIPIAWKDLFDIAGTVTTAGSYTRINAKPATHDAHVVAKLTQMGMVNIGKTNLTEFAYSGLGLNPHFGTPPNALHENCIPGGSSSGSAISVAKNIVPIAMATDTAGSIRIPASFNGLIGYRSSSQRYSKQGVFPLANSLDTTGPIAKSVKDCAILDCLLLSKDINCLLERVTKEDIVFVVDWDILNHKNIQADVVDNFARSVENLKGAGIQILSQKIPAFHETLALIDNGKWPGAAEAYTLHQALLTSDQAELVDPRVRKRLEASKDILASTQIMLYQQASQLKLQIKSELKGHYLLTPTIAHSAPLMRPLQDDDALFAIVNAKTLRLTMLGSFLDMLGITIPNGFDKQGLSTGLLISSINGSDERLLRVADYVEPIIV